MLAAEKAAFVHFTLSALRQTFSVTNAATASSPAFLCGPHFGIVIFLHTALFHIKLGLRYLRENSLDKPAIRSLQSFALVATSS